jgi:hypothetical protein
MSQTAWRKPSVRAALMAETDGPYRFFLAPNGRHYGCERTYLIESAPKRRRNHL